MTTRSKVLKNLYNWIYHVTNYADASNANLRLWYSTLTLSNLHSTSILSWHSATKSQVHSTDMLSTTTYFTHYFTHCQILQEEIKSTSIGPKNEDSLTNGAEYKSHNESHPTNDKNSAWKEIRCTRTTATKHKRYNHTEQRATDTFPLSSNRYNPLCNVSEVDDTPVSTGISRMAESKQVRKHKLDRKRMVGKTT